jgi:hypothetical protein
MFPFTRIPCPTDFSEPALVALKRAEELARHFSAELWVARVIPEVPGSHSFPDPQADFNFDVPLYQQELAIYAENLLKELAFHQISPEERPRRAGGPVQSQPGAIIAFFTSGLFRA